MKVKDIARDYGFDKDDLEQFIRERNLPFKTKLGSMEIPEDIVDSTIRRYNKQLDAIDEEREYKKQQLANMLITSGFSFEGYTITKYSGYISGDDVIEIPRGKIGWLGVTHTEVGKALTDSLVKIRRNALRELKEAAYNLGCNAVIGVDFDYITLDPESASAQGGTVYLPYVFCVTANGNAVVIERN